MLYRFPIEVTIRKLPPSDAIEQCIYEKAEKLSKFHHKIEFCKVVVDIVQKHKHQGKLFDTRIELDVPGKKIIVNHQRNQVLFISIRDAFNAMQRQLDDYAHRQKGHVKTHAFVSMGYIDRIYDDYGFIQTHDGKEFYFHKDNLMNIAFESLKVGMISHFLPGQLGETLQATHINVSTWQVTENLAA